MTNRAKQSEDIRDQAALWVVRDAVSNPRLRAELDLWLTQSAEHEVAYERELAAWRRLDQLSEAQKNYRGPVVHALRPPEPAKPSATVINSARREGRRAAIAAAVLIGVSVGAGVWFVNSAPAYATAVGERRLVVLEDGTKVQLNTDSKIVIRYHPSSRTVELVRGEAQFDVTPNKARPFMVVAERRVVQAVGTAFNVKTQAQGIEVLVSRGIVEVTPQTAVNGGQNARLTQGMIGHFTADGASAAAATSVEVERIQAWRYGAIVLDGETLKEAVHEFNRYNVRKLEIRDPAIENVALGGYFQADDLNSLIRALKTGFRIKAVNGADQKIYLSRDN